MSDVVRPTKRCLTDLKCAIPDLGVRLSDVDHPLLAKAQSVPELVVAGGAERVLALTDRVWFKVKTGTWRAVAADLRDDVIEEFVRLGLVWWLGAAGTRQSDSAQHDFYQQVTDESHRHGRNSCSTEFLLPDQWDVKRLFAEAAVNAQSVVENFVRSAAAESLANSDIRVFMLGDREVRVRIKVQDDGQAYVVIGATGSLDSQFLITVLSAIPGVPVDEWLPEPGGHLDLVVEPGEIVWSTMISAEAQSQLLAYGRGLTL